MYRVKAADLYPLIATDTPGLEEFVQYIESKEYLQRRPTGTIYHYTDAMGLLSMAKNKSLWCTDVEYMNDANELRYAENLIKAKITEIKKANPAHSQFFEILKEEAFRPFGEIYDVYVFSFSEAKNRLSQWRGYGKYCVGFNCEVPFRTDIHSNLPSEWPEARLRKILYSREEQEAIITEIIKGLFTLFQEHLETAEHDYEVVANWYGGNFSNIIFEYLISFKDSTFEEEQEWRLVHLDTKGSNRKEVKFRTRGEHLVPYIESGIRVFDENKFKSDYHELHQGSEEFKKEGVGFDDFMRAEGTFPISYVGIGPVNHLKIAKQSTVNMLQSYGLSEVTVEATDSNIRSDWL